MKDAIEGVITFIIGVIVIGFIVGFLRGIFS